MSEKILQYLCLTLGVCIAFAACSKTEEVGKQKVHINTKEETSSKDFKEADASDENEVLCISIQEALKTPDRFLGKKIQLEAFFRDHIPDGPWLCADPQYDLRLTLSITNLSECAFIYGEQQPKDGMFGSGYVYATGVLKKGRYYNAPYEEYMEDVLFFELSRIEYRSDKFESKRPPSKELDELGDDPF